MPAAPATYTAMSLNCLYPWFKSTQDEVKAGKTLPWERRMPLLAASIKGSGAQLVMAQELGHDEAAGLAAKLGASWSYQRNGLAAILWSDHWKIEDPTHNDESRDWQLTAYGQFAGGRTLIVCRLRHTQTGQYVFAASCHLANNSGWGVTGIQAANARRKQAKEVAAHLHAYRQILLAGDFNSRTSLPGTPRAVLKADGWTFLEPPGKPGIDAVGSKQRVTLKSVTVVPLGAGSDHDGRKIRFSITDPPNPA